MSQAGILGSGGSGGGSIAGTIRFVAYLSTAQTDATGDGTNFVIPFDTAVVSVGGGFDPLTGIFTAPSTGTYQFSSGIAAVLIGALHTTWNSAFALSNAFTVTGDSLFNPFVASSGGSVEANSSAITFLTAGDTVSVDIAIGTSTKTITIFGEPDNYLTYFAGSIIG